MTGRIFITNKEVKKRMLENGYWYSYAKGVLNVYSSKQLVLSQHVKAGDALVVMYGDTVTIEKMQPPKKNGDLIAWLIGFSKFNRTSSKERYKKILEYRKDMYLWEKYKEWSYIGEKFIITRCNRYEKTDGYHNVVARVEYFQQF